MLTNLPTIFKMLTDSNFRRFLKRVQASVPSSNSKRSLIEDLKLVDLVFKGERVVRFNRVYVVISLIPPLGTEAFIRFIQTSGSNIFSDGGPVRMKAPISASLAMTNRCSYRCLHCGVNLPKGVRELTTAEWISVIGEMIRMGTSYFSLSGGEPLLRDDMEEIIASMGSAAVAFLFTNGKGLSFARARSLKKAGLFGLSVSLDSADPDTHNSMRNDPHAFEHALGAICNSRKAGLYTIAQAVVFRSGLNRRKLFKLFKLAKSAGAHEFRILKPAQAGCLLDTEDESIFYTEADDAFITRIQFAANRRWWMPKVTCFPFSEIGKFCCTAGVRHGYITAAGEFTPCDFIPLSFGNVLKEDMRVIWRRMNDAVGVPKHNCWSKALAPFLRGRRLPFEPCESLKLAQEFQKKEMAAFKL